MLDARVVRAELARRQWTIARLAVASRCSRCHLTQVLNGRESPSPALITRLAVALGKPVHWLVVKPPPEERFSEQLARIEEEEATLAARRRYLIQQMRNYEDGEAIRGI